MANWSNPKTRNSMQRIGSILHNYKLFYIPGWILIANNLKEAAEVVLKKQNKGCNKPLTLISKKSLKNLNIASINLLYGFAFEALLKAILIKQGKIKSHQQAKKHYHNLDKMAKEAGLKFDTIESRSILLAKEAILWKSKYPTPLSSDDFYLKDEKNELIMSVNYNHYFWLHQLYNKILTFLKEEKFYSNELALLHSLTDKRINMYDKMYKKIKKNGDYRKIQNEIKIIENEIDKVAKQLLNTSQ